jgi:hypothetical protein
MQCGWPKHTSSAGCRLEMAGAVGARARVHCEGERECVNQTVEWSSIKPVVLSHRAVCRFGRTSLLIPRRVRLHRRRLIRLSRSGLLVCAQRERKQKGSYTSLSLSLSRTNATVMVAARCG